MELSLMDILSAIRKKLVLVVVCTLLGIALMGAYTVMMVEPMYTATAKMYVYKEEVTSITSSDLLVRQSMVSTYLVIAESDTVMEDVADRLSDKYPNVSARTLKSMFRGSAINETEAFTLSMTSADPQLAQSAVNTLIDVLPAEVERLIKGCDVGVIDEAKLPTAASWPLTRNVALGAMLGLILSAGYAILVFMFDTTVYSREDLSRNFSQPVLGAIPLMEGFEDKKTRKRSLKYPWKNPEEEHRSSEEESKNILNENTPFAVSEAYRMARTNLIYLPSDKPCKKFVITSCYQREGKTTTAINLAIALAQNNNKVILIDADLRKPRIAKNIGIRYENGLTEYLAGITSTVSAIKVAYDNLYVIPSGKESTLAAELLATGRMGTLLQQLEDKCDYIIIDTPPLNVVTDASVLANLVDGYLLSVRADRSNVNAIKQVFATLEQVNANVFGFLLNSVDPKTGSGYYKYGKYYNGNKYYKYSKYSNYEPYMNEPDDPEEKLTRVTKEEAEKVERNDNIRIGQ